MIWVMNDLSEFWDLFNREETIMITMHSTINNIIMIQTKEAGKW